MTALNIHRQQTCNSVINKRIRWCRFHSNIRTTNLGQECEGATLFLPRHQDEGGQTYASAFCKPGFTKFYLFYYGPCLRECNQRNLKAEYSSTLMKAKATLDTTGRPVVQLLLSVQPHPQVHHSKSSLTPEHSLSSLPACLYLDTKDLTK